MQGEGRHVLGIDLIRFLAAAMVVAFHYDHAFPRTHLPFASAGWVGVEVFFVISGYVIANSAESTTAANFAKARLLRLLPGAWICGTITAAVAVSSANAFSLANQYIRTIIFWPTGPFVDTVYWTLPIEVIFYVFVFCTLGRFSLLSLNALTRALGILSGAWWLARVAVTLGLRLAIHPEWFAFVPPIVISLIQFGCYFALGALIQECLRDRIDLERAAHMCICLGACLLQIAYAASRITVGLQPLQSVIVAPIVAWSALVLAIWISVFWNGAASRALGQWSGIFRTIGLSTYPLYLLHARFGSWLGHAGHLGPLQTAVLIVGLSVVVAKVLEPAVRRVLRPVLSAASLGSIAVQPATQEPV